LGRGGFPSGATRQHVRCEADAFIRGNAAEDVFSLFNRGMKGVHQHCAEKHLHRYLAELDFRFNNRTAVGVNDGERATFAVKSAAGKRSTGGLTSPDFSQAAKRFKRWRKKNWKLPKRKIARIWVR